MDWQQIISLLVVALAASLLVLRQVRKRQRAKLRPCGHDCHCATTSSEGLADTITYTMKKDPAHSHTH